MAGSTFGNQIKITTWGETHGKGVGVVIDGCPAGLSLKEEDIQVYLDRRKPGQSRFTTKRKESDTVSIWSGVFEGKTTGTPISLIVENKDQRSRDYSAIAGVYRPGHADYTFDKKYGLRDYRGGGRSSGRETVARVAAGAVCAKVLQRLGITLFAYTESIGPITVDTARFDPAQRDGNSLYMPDAKAALKAEAYLEKLIEKKDSAGGTIRCVVKGLPAGIGDPVFDKLDARLSAAMFSIGAVKGVEIGDGFAASKLRGTENNDAFSSEDGRIFKTTNHAGGILGGISDGSDVEIRVAVKPTPSVASIQQTVTKEGIPTEIEIGGRHDPVIVPRAVVVVEAMAAVTILDLLIQNTGSRMSYLEKIYS